MAKVVDIISILYEDIRAHTPEHFNPEEVRARMLKGDPEARTQLIYGYLWLAIHQAKWYAYHNNMQFEDFIGPAFEGLVEGIDYIHTDKVAPYMYAFRGIRNACNKFIALYKNDNHCWASTEEEVRYKSLDYEVPETGTKISDLIDASVFERAWSWVEENDLNERLSRLTPRDRQVIELAFGIGKSFETTPEDIAKSMNYSVWGVKCIINRALRKML